MIDDKPPLGSNGRMKGFELCRVVILEISWDFFCGEGAFGVADEVAQ